MVEHKFAVTDQADTKHVNIHREGQKCLTESVTDRQDGSKMHVHRKDNSSHESG